MNSLKPINLDNGVIEIHPFRMSDITREKELVEDLFEIFGDHDSLPFSEEKFVKSRDIISTQIMGVTIGYQTQMQYTHFITLKDSKKTIGEIIILSPKNVEPEYGILETWLIEFYLNKHFWNNRIMSGVISAVIRNMKEQGKRIGALVKRDNTASVRVLTNSGFMKSKTFDLLQDFYEVE